MALLFYLKEEKMLKCATCEHSVFNELWGEWKCKERKIWINEERSNLVTLCLDYKLDPKKAAEVNEK